MAKGLKYDEKNLEWTLSYVYIILALDQGNFPTAANATLTAGFKWAP